MHLARVPQIITPIRTRPVVLKAPVTPVTIPRQIIVRDNERDATQLASGGGKAKLKFGIDSILGEDSIAPKRSSTEDRLGKLVLLIYRVVSFAMEREQVPPQITAKVCVRWFVLEGLC